MPSFWGRLCVRRQRYSTHKPTEPRYTQKGDSISHIHRPAVMVEIQSERSWRKEDDPDWTKPQESRSNGTVSPVVSSIQNLPHSEWTKVDGGRSSWTSPKESVQRGTDDIETHTAVVSDSGRIQRNSSSEKKKLGAKHSVMSDSYELGHSLMQANCKLLQHPNKPSAATNEQLRRSLSEGLATTDTDNTKKKRHVQDIFIEHSQRDKQESNRGPHHTEVVSLRSTTSSRRSRQSSQNDEPRKTESMYLYSPRSVNDDAISAALFGGRIDDFIPNPAWNLAIDRFASSPTPSGAQSSFSGRAHPRPENFPSVGKRAPTLSDSSVTYSSKSQDTATSRPQDDYASQLTTPQGSVSDVTESEEASTTFAGCSGQTETPLIHFGFKRSETDGNADLDLASLGLRGDDAHERQSSPGVGSALDLEKVFGSIGDVLY